MLVSACYCLSDSPQLFDNPTSQEEVNICWECVCSHKTNFDCFSG
jgi:hypothetical protein